MASFNVSASGDDGGYSGTTWSVIAYYHVIGKYGGGATNQSFCRFNNINILKGSTINSAYITFVSPYDDSATTCNIRIYGNKIANAVAPTSIAEFNALTLTTAYVDWSNLSAWTAASSYNTSDLSSIIQEIVNQDSWLSGNSLMLLIFDGGSTAGAIRRFASWNNVSYTEPILTITWTEPSGASFTQKIVMF